ncbi:MAG: helix-turn-helix transcriptional regulator [Acidithiobacillus ferrivorans]
MGGKGDGEQYQEKQIMKKTAAQLAFEEENIEFELANELSPSSHVTINGDVIHLPAQNGTPEIKRLRRIQAQITQEKLLLKKALRNCNVVRIMPGQHARRTQKRRGADGKRQATAGDSNDSDPEPHRPGLADEAAFAAQICISKKTLQNIYSKTPHLLPKAISIPGARGPRWTQAAIEEWLNSRPQHSPAPVPVAPKPKRSVGRPRIAALRSNGGAS